ncbi:hypothetical protein OO015_04960 [Thermomicrobium sp. 4228-Ro]|uniref:hypothetical protein n=1 Tax=Thermomicrobium sp. 4228-Ro TaxID=2993937 RepID=UPI0022494CFF|nr:hypothetical protein [Thermomicrobium sp. 4228-Ro]MCX2726843.1 hypothetical protein [Thermomicrobium sp. 4228-Ro]
MGRRADRLWLLFFVPGASLIAGHLVLTRLFGVVLTDGASAVIGLFGVGFLLLSLLTQLSLPRRRTRRDQGEKR